MRAGCRDAGAVLKNDVYRFPGAPQMWSAGGGWAGVLLSPETLTACGRPGHRLHPAPGRRHDSHRRHRSRIRKLLPHHALQVHRGRRGGNGGRSPRCWECSCPGPGHRRVNNRMPSDPAYQALPSVPCWIGGRASGDRKVPFFSSDRTTNRRRQRLGSLHSDPTNPPPYSPRHSSTKLLGNAGRIGIFAL
jgi:hypothetical protein